MSSKSSEGVKTLMPILMLIISSHLFLQGLSHFMPYATRIYAISSSTKVLKFVESKQHDNDQFTIRSLASLEHLTLPKTNWPKQCKSRSKTFAPYYVCIICTCGHFCSLSYILRKTEHPKRV